jgi:hypothetical protein
MTRCAPVTAADKVIRNSRNTVTCVHAAAQDVVQRVGSKGPLGDFARALCARLSPQLISSQHVEELLTIAADEALPDEAFLQAVLIMLTDAAAAAPGLYAGRSSQVCRVLCALMSGLQFKCV